MEYLLKMLFFANIASNLKVESMHFAHRNCEYILGVIYLLCFPVWLWADNKVNTYHFKSISTSVNFPTNEVRKLFQDSQGYIWISTYNGLLRYDGYSIVVYKPDGVNHGRSIDSFVNMVAEDKENNLWIGTHNGLYVLHKETDEIEKIISPLLQVSNVESILYASNGDLWVGSNKGLFRRKAGSRTFDCEKTMDIKSVVEDRKGQIWIGTWEQGLLRYNPQEELYYTYEGINPGNSAHVIFQDEAGNIWIGTWRYGLVKLINPYDPEHFSFKTFRNIKGNSHSLLDNIIYAIAQDKNSGKLWIGSRSGVSILEDESGDGNFTNIVPGNLQGDLPFNEVNSLLCSKDGLMWLGMLQEVLGKALGAAGLLELFDLGLRANLCLTPGNRTQNTALLADIEHHVVQVKDLQIAWQLADLGVCHELVHVGAALKLQRGVVAKRVEADLVADTLVGQEVLVLQTLAQHLAAMVKVLVYALGAVARANMRLVYCHVYITCPVSAARASMSPRSRMACSTSGSSSRGWSASVRCDALKPALRRIWR